MNINLITLPVLLVQNELASPLPLEHTSVQVQVTGLSASVTVSQRFRNPLTTIADLEYLFPLPHDSAVTGFELQAGSRTIHATVQEIEQARSMYETARNRGQRTSLLEMRRPNLFALQLANIQPGEFILAVSHYQQRLELTSGNCEFVYPMGITPKYHRPGEEAEASRTDAPITLDDSQVGDVEISMSAETGADCADPLSPSHPIRIRRTSGSSFQVQLDGSHLPNADFVLRWRYTSEEVQLPGWQSPDGYFMATFIPPTIDTPATPHPREYIFVIDRSGSMSSEPLKQAVNAVRACLRTLNPQDSFAILLFDDRLEWLSKPTPVTQPAIDAVDKLLANVEARGGTEIQRALEAALKLKLDNRQRILVFLTDGAVSAEAQTLKQVRAIIGSSRLFTFGVGSSVNRAFIQQLAHIGRGESSFINPDEDIEEAILRFQDSIAYPLLTNLSLSAENGSIWDVYPAQLPDLYVGRPLQVVGRLKASSDLPLSLLAQGERAGKPLEMRSTLTPFTADPALLPRLWARARVDVLLEQSELGLKREDEARAEIIPLAIENHLLTQYTAFVVVDSDTPATPGISQHIKVAQPVPQMLHRMAMSAPTGTLYSKESSPPDINSLNENLPTFLRSMTSKRSSKSMMAQPLDDNSLDEIRSLMDAQLMAAQANSDTRLKSLRNLARTQQLDGSWQADVELTAAALLAFVRSGFTTHKGMFRVQVGRAFEWLLNHPAEKLIELLRLLALLELVNATADPAQNTAVDQITALTVEQIQSSAAGYCSALPTNNQTASSLEDLRLMVILKTEGCQVTDLLLKDFRAQVLEVALI